MKPYWVTFYSYKGGVGRSLALANTAALLVKRGRRVLLIDFDLEAPGLDSFAEFASAAGKAGVVEYVSEFQRRKAAPDIREFVHKCELSGPLRGELFVMPAGRKDAVYNHLLPRIQWTEFYETSLGAPFFANWKAAIDRQFQPDFVFIDSRTGLTEIGGVCTTQFPDLVVMLFGLNQQNIQGTATVGQSIREADPERIPQFHHVATPVPNLPSANNRSGDPSAPPRKSLVQERLDAASAVLGVTVSSTIRYYPPAGLLEKLFVLDDEAARQPFLNDYTSLCVRIIGFNRTGLDFLLLQSNRALSEEDEERRSRLDAILARDFPDRADALFMRSRFARAAGHLDLAVEYARTALRNDPAHQQSFEFLVGHFTKLRDWDAAASVYDQVLACGHLLSEERLDEVRRDSAHVLMAIGRPFAAADRYDIGLSYGRREEDPPDVMLGRTFNLAEALRRHAGTINTEVWRTVVDLFEQSGEGSDDAPPEQANRWQAMHVAFAAVGDLKRAFSALRKAQQISELVGEAEDIFSVQRYTMVPVAEFRAENSQMLAALERGELWDGMKLPSAQP